MTRVVQNRVFFSVGSMISPKLRKSVVSRGHRRKREVLGRSFPKANGSDMTGVATVT